MFPTRVLKIYSRARNGKTVDVEEVVFHLEEPRAVGAHSKVSVALNNGHVILTNAVGGVIFDEEVPRNVLRITWDDEVLFDATKKMF